MTPPPLLTNSGQPTEVFLVLHESANRPETLEYEYMTGRLRLQLSAGAFGPPLTEKGKRRARSLGRRLRGMGISFVLTDDFITPLESARLMAAAAENGMPVPVVSDNRVRESDLSYLTRRRFKMLGRAEAAGDPNATVRDWIQHRPEDFADLVKQHIDVWNQIVDAHQGKRFVVVLHVDGFLLYPTLLLGAPAEHMVRLHIPRAHPVHVRLFSDRPPLVSVGDEAYWRLQPATAFGQYG